MHAELTMNVTNEAPSSTHERRADGGGEASICLLSFGALYLTYPTFMRSMADMGVHPTVSRGPNCRGPYEQTTADRVETMFLEPQLSIFLWGGAFLVPVIDGVPIVRGW
jgi:hypothetical protein